MTHGTARPSVLLIREWEQQMSSSGCCGRLEGDFLASGAGGEPCFVERRRIMEEMGPLYRGLRAAYGDAVDVEVVDPRSFPTLLSLLVRDWMRHRVGIGAALRTLAGVTVTSVVVNGRLLARGSWPSVDAVAERLGPVPKRAEESHVGVGAHPAPEPDGAELGAR